jgi:hypothetical protein
MGPPFFGRYDRRLDVPENLDHAFEGAKDTVATPFDRNQLSHGPPALRDHDGFASSPNLIHNF